ncbi:hypothetical protein ACFPM1_09365 [Halorubrum rubrum]|uniref:Metal-dependent hydrolase n=1 Tax=Halorubrum rubrum TaxID=1126240 RepID=A0ABD5R265_9EURY|nr:hypothetical protein [Halorubrum rubrum]
MYSRNHALVSAAVGIPLAFVAPDPFHPLLVWSYVVVLGVAIDIDHFLIARLNLGDWRNVRRCLRRPARMLVDQKAIFAPGDLWRDQRLFSHMLLFATLTVLVWSVDAYLAFVTAASGYVHVVSDLYADMRTREEYVRNASESMPDD